MRIRYLRSRIPLFLHDHVDGCYFTGIKSDEGNKYKGTHWSADGRIVLQLHDGVLHRGPPWLWQVTHQEEPDPPPWFRDDSLFEDFVLPK